jgi:hypothetical protein
MLRNYDTKLIIEDSSIARENRRLQLTKKENNKKENYFFLNAQ